MGAFGEKFREERERRGFTLDDISNVTKIASRMLQAIEQERFDLLPGGVFNKGFVRAYAKHLAFNDEQAVAEYLAALRQAQIDAQTAGWDQPPQSSKAPLPTAAIPPKAGSAEPQPKIAEQKSLLSSLRLTSFKPAVRPALSPSLSPEFSSQTWPEQRPSGQEPSSGPPPLIQPSLIQPSSFQRTSVQPSPTQEATSQPPLTARASQPAPQIHVQEPPAIPRIAGGAIPALRVKHAAAAIPRARETDVPWKIVALVLAALAVAALLWSRHANNASPQATARAAVTSPTSAKPDGTTAGPARSGASKTAAPSTAAGASAKISATSATAHSASVKPKTPATFRLAIRASENSWISVTADGQVVSRENLIAPANTAVRASREIVVRVGNAAGVSFLFNDRRIPPQGAEGEARTFVFDSTGMQTTTPGTSAGSLAHSPD